jgi:hypothetical protein
VPFAFYVIVGFAFDRAVGGPAPSRPRVPRKTVGSGPDVKIVGFGRYAGSTNTGYAVPNLDRRSASEEEPYDEENQENNEQDPGNLRGGAGDATETQETSDQSDDKKRYSPT